MTTNYRHGHDAEKVAAKYLEKQGYKIVELNWKTPRCEIDIVAKKDKTLYFVEVKYRANLAQGGGLDYITPAKLRQMKYAAETYVLDHDYTGPHQLSALELSGSGYEITQFVSNLF